jgi:biofilm PGA synthesis N-glycosyltransferase PgaC
MQLDISFFFQCIVISCYLFVIIAAFYGWHKIKGNQEIKISLPVFVSIVVAARNEDENIPLLLSDLGNQSYPLKYVEWIIIDDHSLNKISNLPEIKKYQNLTIIDLGYNEKGKKPALAAGVKHSKGELLLFTDADCRVKAGWIESFVGKYLEEKAGMIVGLVDYPKQSEILKKFFHFELLSLIITGSGLTNIGFPVMCNGANIAVRADLYKKNQKNIKPGRASGDDVFMLHAVKKDRSVKISILRSKNSIVITSAPKNISEFLNQRSRWASKSTAYRDRDTIILAFIVLLANLIIILGFIDYIVTGKFTNLIVSFFIKLAADFSILASGLSFFGGKRNILFLPLFSIFYPFYILIVVTRSIFKSYTWKERQGF